MMSTSLSLTYDAIFLTSPGARRGDHYHTKKLEWLSCVAGEMTILLEDKEGNKSKVILNADDPKLIYFGPHTSHAFLNTTHKPAYGVCYGSKQHDPKDPDTFPKVIEYGN